MYWHNSIIGVPKDHHKSRTLKKSSDSFNKSQNLPQFINGPAHIPAKHKSLRKSLIGFVNNTRAFETDTNDTSFLGYRSKLKQIESRQSFNGNNHQDKYGLFDLKKQIQMNKQRYTNEGSVFTINKQQAYRNTYLDQRYAQTLEKTQSLSANHQFDDFVSEQYLKMNQQMQKKRAKRIVFSANKTSTKAPKIEQKFQPYEDQSVLTLPNRRRLNTGLMLTTLKQNMNLYGQAATHVRTAEASELASQMTLEREQIASEKKKEKILEQQKQRQTRSPQKLEYTRSPLLLDQKKEAKSPVEAFHFRYKKQDYMERQIKSKEKNFMEDFHVVENSHDAPIIINLKGNASMDSKSKLREVRLGDHKEYSDLKELKKKDVKVTGGFQFNDNKIVIKDEQEGLRFVNNQSLTRSNNHSVSQQIDRQVALKSGEGMVTTTNYTQGLFNSNKKSRTSKTNTQKSIQKQKYRQVDVRYPNGKKMNAGLGGIIEKIQQNSVMQDTFLSEFKFPSPRGQVQELQSLGNRYQNIHQSRAKSISPPISPKPLDSQQQQFNSPALTTKQNRKSIQEEFSPVMKKSMKVFASEAQFARKGSIQKNSDKKSNRLNISTQQKSNRNMSQQPKQNRNMSQQPKSIRNSSQQRSNRDMSMEKAKKRKVKKTTGSLQSFSHHNKRPWKDKDTDGYSEYSKKLYKEVDITKNKRAQSAKPVNIHGIEYKFQMVDLAKYTDRLKYGNFNWPVKYCTMGKKIPKPEQRKEVLVREIHFDTLLRVLRQTDWSRAPIYEMYTKEGRWKHNEDNLIYSEIEIQYLLSSLTKMVSADKYEEFNEVEGVAIIEKHWVKTVDTLRTLMNQMNMMYFYEKLKFKINELTKDGNRPSLVHLEKIMSRCLKLYQMIDNFIKIFKLIDQKEKLENAFQQNVCVGDPRDERKTQILLKRITVAIWLVLKENPILPLSFNFKGKCLLLELKKQREEYKQRRKKLQARRDQSGSDEKSREKSHEASRLKFQETIQTTEQTIQSPSAQKKVKIAEHKQQLEPVTFWRSDQV